MNGRDIVIELARNRDGSDPGDHDVRDRLSEDEIVVRLASFSPRFPDGWSDARIEAARSRPWLEPDLLWTSDDGLLFRIRRELIADPRDRFNAISSAVTQVVEAGLLSGGDLFDEVRRRVPDLKRSELLDVALKMKVTDIPSFRDDE